MKLSNIRGLIHAVAALSLDQQVEVFGLKAIRKFRCSKSLVRNTEYPIAFTAEKMDMMAAVCCILWGRKGIAQLTPIKSNAVNHILLQKASKRAVHGCPVKMLTNLFPNLWLRKGRTRLPQGLQYLNPAAGPRKVFLIQQRINFFHKVIIFATLLQIYNFLRSLLQFRRKFRNKFNK